MSCKTNNKLHCITTSTEMCLIDNNYTTDKMVTLKATDTKGNNTGFCFIGACP